MGKPHFRSMPSFPDALGYSRSDEEIEAMLREEDTPLADRPKRVLVSGCYDLLHSGHVAFFKEAAALGDLYVSVGSDVNVTALKKKPMFPENERVYMVQAIRHVHEAFVCTGSGDIDWVSAIDTVKPDIFFVNDDGDRPAKREACAAHGLEYVVAVRVPDGDLTPRSSTSIKRETSENNASK